MSNIIVMAFSPRNIVGCLLKKRLTKGGGGSRAPQDPPLATPLAKHVHKGPFTQAIFVAATQRNFCRAEVVT